MPRFSQRDPAESGMRMAGSAMRAIQKTDAIASVGTVRAYESCLRQVATHLAGRGETLRELTPERATAYLEGRAAEVGQKTLDMERQAIQCMMQNYSHRLERGETLPVVKSELEQKLSSRAYTAEQIAAVAEHQAPKNALATEIAYSAGLRAHELATLRPIAERAPDIRPAHEEKFAGRSGERYSVIGKGGLCREVVIPSHLAARLEERRLDAPQIVRDRGIDYEKHYAIGSGQAFSQSFSDASKRALGWSEGAHAERHAYAQERMAELRSGERGLDRERAKEIVAQELGHFRPETTEVYLR